MPSIARVTVSEVASPCVATQVSEPGGPKRPASQALSSGACLRRGRQAEGAPFGRQRRFGQYDRNAMVQRRPTARCCHDFRLRCAAPLREGVERGACAGRAAFDHLMDRFSEQQIADRIDGVIKPCELGLDRGSLRRVGREPVLAPGNLIASPRITQQQPINHVTRGD